MPDNPRWSQMGLNDLRWPDPNEPKQSQMVPDDLRCSMMIPDPRWDPRCAQVIPDDPRRYRMIPNEIISKDTRHRWSKMIPDDHKRSQMIPDDPRWYQMIPDDPKWSQDDPRWSQTKWFQMIPTPDDPRWYKMISDEMISDVTHGPRWSKCLASSICIMLGEEGGIQKVIGSHFGHLNHPISSKSTTESRIIYFFDVPQTLNSALVVNEHWKIVVVSGWGPGFHCDRNLQKRFILEGLGSAYANQLKMNLWQIDKPRSPWLSALTKCLFNPCFDPHSPSFCPNSPQQLLILFSIFWTLTYLLLVLTAWFEALNSFVYFPNNFYMSKVMTCDRNVKIPNTSNIILKTFPSLG